MPSPPVPPAAAVPPRHRRLLSLVLLLASANAGAPPIATAASNCSWQGPSKPAKDRASECDEAQAALPHPYAQMLYHDDTGWAYDAPVPAGGAPGPDASSSQAIASARASAALRCAVCDGPSVCSAIDTPPHYGRRYYGGNVGVYADPSTST